MELKLPRKGNPMTDYCAFSKDHKCIKWTDYELLRHELEYIGQLQALLIKNGIEIPPEY